MKAKLNNAERLIECFQKYGFKNECEITRRTKIKSLRAAQASRNTLAWWSTADGGRLFPEADAHIKKASNLACGYAQSQEVLVYDTHIYEKVYLGLTAVGWQSKDYSGGAFAPHLRYVTTCGEQYLYAPEHRENIAEAHRASAFVETLASKFTKLNELFWETESWCVGWRGDGLDPQPLVWSEGAVAWNTVDAIRERRASAAPFGSPADTYDAVDLT